MPTYVYQCQACQYMFETVHRMTEAGPAVCPQCQAPTPQRRITSGQFILKGEGWYRDGYGARSSAAASDER